jgi:hypothetical protein
MLAAVLVALQGKTPTWYDDNAFDLETGLFVQNME